MQQTEQPYDVTFSFRQNTGLYESKIASSSLSVSPYLQDYLGISDAQAVELSLLAGRIEVANNKEQPEVVRVNLHELKRLGSFLLFFANDTNDVLHRMQLPAVQPISYTIRRIEGLHAQEMVETIKKRNITVSELKKPPRMFPVGFSK